MAIGESRVWPKRLTVRFSKTPTGAPQKPAVGAKAVALQAAAHAAKTPTVAKARANARVVKMCLTACTFSSARKLLGLISVGRLLASQTISPSSRTCPLWISANCTET